MVSKVKSANLSDSVLSSDAVEFGGIVLRLDAKGRAEIASEIRAKMSSEPIALQLADAIERLVT